MSRKTRLVLRSLKSFLASRRTFLFLVGSPILVPSARMTFSGGEISRAKGRPAHWRPIRMR